MKITNAGSGSISGLSHSQEASQLGQASRGESGHSGSGGDQVHLSNLGAQLGVSGSSAARAAKVAHLTAAVSSGRYHVNASSVSASIIHEHTKTGV